MILVNKLHFTANELVGQQWFYIKSKRTGKFLRIRSFKRKDSEYILYVGKDLEEVNYYDLDKLYMIDDLSFIQNNLEISELDGYHTLDTDKFLELK